MVLNTPYAEWFMHLPKLDAALTTTMEGQEPCCLSSPLLVVTLGSRKSGVRFIESREGRRAYTTIMGFEVMRALRKGQAAVFNITQDIRGEARTVQRASGIGAGALAKA